jgi:hypothetical protein
MKLREKLNINEEGTIRAINYQDIEKRVSRAILWSQNNKKAQL